MNAALFVRSERVHRINGACFYPVPPIESALVRLTPRNPPPMFNFAEFSAMTKIAFIEKKRGLKTVFSRPFVERTLEAHYKQFCSYHRIPTSTLAFPKYLQSALTDSGLAEYPAKHLAPEAMEHLLGLFHERGIFFTNIGASPSLTKIGNESEIGEELLFPIQSVQASPSQPPTRSPGFLSRST
ncbi:hypothetical protein C9890_0415, partial [Perkinsus sp. BL_2016]